VLTLLTVAVVAGQTRASMGTDEQFQVKTAQSSTTLMLLQIEDVKPPGSLPDVLEKMLDVPVALIVKLP